MERAGYKGYVIESNPRQLADGTWSINVGIESHEGGCVRSANYHAANTFATDLEATEHGMNFGRQIIHGRVPGISPP